jgi:hypothetical protein
MDIFDNEIICKNCKKTMKPSLLRKNGFNLRTLKCEKCNEIIIHPEDKQEYEEFMRLKQKEFNVKMRMVGNSYAVSIPREIVDFMKEQENLLSNMVKMSFQDAGRISLMFGNNCENADNEDSNVKSRIVSAKEVKIVRNGKPVLHARKFYDSANPKNNKTQVFKNIEKNQEDFEEEEH